MEQIEIIKPDDWHVHFRDNEILKAVVPETSKHFARAIVMPNLTPPILDGYQAKMYKERILKATPKKHEFEPLMTLYLTEKTNKNTIKKAYEQKYVFAAKLYPAGATTNSESGVREIKNILPLLEVMSEIGMPLLIHGEVTNKEVDIFDREKKFVDTILSFICKEFPELRVTLEHITTKEAVDFVCAGNKKLVASITPHHLALNRNAMFEGGIRPHNYCLPVLKREIHQKYLIKAATSGNPKFFLGTDTAPHLRGEKENSCGCAGIFNSSYCLSIIAEIFEKENSIEKLESFVSVNGALHYNCNINKTKITLRKLKNPLKFKKSLKFLGKEIMVFNPNFNVFWQVQTYSER